jgi:hypothetical protein
VCERDDVDLVVLDTAGSIIKDRVVSHGRCVAWLLVASTEVLAEGGSVRGEPFTVKPGERVRRVP